MTAPRDDDDRLLADLLDGKAAADDGEAQRRAPYELLVAMLREHPAPGWGQRVDARVERALHAQRRRRQQMIGAGAALALAAVIALMVRRSDRPAPPRVAVSIVAPDGAARRGATHVGDQLVVEVQAKGPNVALRVYREARAIAVCPGDAGCAHKDGSIGVTLPLTAAGRYQILFATSNAALPPAGTGPPASFDADVLTLRKAGAQVELLQPLIVNP